jgi:hypothetical protein
LEAVHVHCIRNLTIEVAVIEDKSAYSRDWFSLRLFKALNISTTTSTVIETVDG